jgi:hypothetical protein
VRTPIVDGEDPITVRHDGDPAAPSCDDDDPLLPERHELGDSDPALCGPSSD